MLNISSVEKVYLACGSTDLRKSIKPFVIRRKNWLFSNTSRGAKSSATIYSIDEFLPWSNTLPAYCKISTKE